MTKPYILLRLG